MVINENAKLLVLSLTNCLMNDSQVSGLYDDTRSWKGLKTQWQEPLSQRQRLWTFVREILSHVIKMFHLVLSTLLGLPNNGLDYYLDYLLDLQEKEPNRTFFLSLVGMSPEETHTILKKSSRE